MDLVSFSCLSAVVIISIIVFRIFLESLYIGHFFYSSCPQVPSVEWDLPCFNPILSLWENCHEEGLIWRNNTSRYFFFLSKFSYVLILYFVKASFAILMNFRSAIFTVGCYYTTIRLYNVSIQDVRDHGSP